MTLFDLLFILLFFTTIFSLLTAAWFAVRQQFRRAATILARVLIGAAVYFTIVIAVSLFSSRRVLKPGDRQCFDDMCVSIRAYQREPLQSGVQYKVEVGLFNRGRGVSQRENNLVLYLIDDQNRRYDPVANNSDAPFNVKLRPKESAVVTRSFLIPENVRAISAVITHAGGFPIGWLIIDYDTWFRKPPLVPLS